MDADEIGRAIGELENRVERLRSLYEQYFMGIERLEPLTLRKDVDRRLWALRREQIRNTGLRFKLETTIQRYNTYQQYWQRIVREIEAGTYKRDIGRAAQRFGDNVVTAFARRRQKMYEKGLEKKAERDAMRRTGEGGASQAPPPQDAVEEAPPSSNDYEVTFEESEAAEPAAAHRPQVPTAGAPPRPPTPSPPSPPSHEPLELEISEPAPPPPRTPAAARPPMGSSVTDPRRPAPVAARPAPAPGAPAAPTVAGQRLATGPQPAPPVAGQRPPTGPQRPAPMAAASPHAAPPAVNPGPARPAQATGAAPPPYATPPGVPAKPAPPAGTGAAKPGTPLSPAAKPPMSAPSAQANATAAKPAPAAPPVVRPVAPAAAVRPPAARPGAPVGPAAPIAAKPVAPTGPAVAPKPAAVPPARPMAPSRPDGPGAVLSDENGLSPIRMRQIYGQFVEAKRKANESTAAVTYEKIASNLENVAKELRAKHNARSVDFEVVMKNGKPVLKPVVKG